MFKERRHCRTTYVPTNHLNSEFSQKFTKEFSFQVYRQKLNQLLFLKDMSMALQVEILQHITLQVSKQQPPM